MEIYKHMMLALKLKEYLEKNNEVDGGFFDEFYSELIKIVENLTEEEYDARKEYRAAFPEHALYWDRAWGITMNKLVLRCDVCQSTSFSSEEMAMTGKWSRLFNYSNKIFTVVSCNHCGHSRFFRKDARFNILEAIVG